MRKVIKIGFPILCLAVIGGTFILLNNTTKRINKNRLPEDDGEEISTEIPVEDTIIEETSLNDMTINTDEEKAQELKNKAKAIEIIKKLAPPVTNSYYTNEGMNNDKYLVAVRDNTTKDATIYYSVDIENEKYEIYVK